MVYIKDNVVFKNSNCNGSDIIAYIKDNVVFKNTNCNGSDIIAYIKDNVVFKNTNCNGSDIIGTVSKVNHYFHILMIVLLQLFLYWQKWVQLKHHNCQNPYVTELSDIDGT